MFFSFSAPNQIASASEGDYDPSSLVTMVTFGNGETLKSVTVQVLNDNVPELEEYFTVHLQNPQGGKAIIDPNKVLHATGCVLMHSDGLEIRLLFVLYCPTIIIIIIIITVCVSIFSQHLRLVYMLMTIREEFSLFSLRHLILMKTLNLKVGIINVESAEMNEFNCF